MTLHLWLVYLGVITVLIAVPGPSALLSMTHGLRYGQRRALATILGGATGSLLLMTASALGLGAVLAASATAFLVLKVVGALYLIWLGISAWRTQENTLTPSSEVEESAPGALGLYRRGFMVGVSNPKDILFFCRTVSQFYRHGCAAGDAVCIAGVDLGSAGLQHHVYLRLYGEPCLHAVCSPTTLAVV
ncbi:hypothetical protein OS12_17940 [Dickeya oryzae]